MTFALAALGCPDDPLCSVCVNNFQCLECLNSWVDSLGRCRAENLPKINNCLSFDSKDDKGSEIKCRECQLGYKLNKEQNTCERCAQDHCALCGQDRLICQACFGGRAMLSGTCSDSAAQVENCEVSTQDECKLCKVGFDLAKNKCVASQSHCLEFKLDGKKCQVCRPGTHISKEGDCVGTPLPILDPTETPKGFSWLKFFLIVLILAAIGAGVYFFMEYKKKRDIERGNAEYTAAN